MRRQTAYVILPICTAILIAGPQPAGAGSLDPPAGAIEPTMKTLQQVEPRIPIGNDTTPGDGGSLFRITQPGSYYLTGNVSGVAGRNGILIAANDVTVDLMGFRLQGGIGTLDGITTDAARNNITIRNGSVRSWAQHGILLVQGGSGFLVEAVHAFNNGVSNNGHGISCHDDGVIRFCTATGNFGNGIQTGKAAIVESCTAFDNGIDGIVASDANTVTNCTAWFNGDDGFVTNPGCTVTNCTARSNGGRGFLVFDGSTVTNCTARSNGIDGFFTGDGCTVTNCTARSNVDDGFFGSDGSTITNCTARFNGDAGFITSDGSTVANCTAQSNGGDGFVASTASTVMNCTAQFNTGDGIQVFLNCRVVGNHCTSNGVGDGAGIHAISDDNRIDGNNVTENDRGIDVDAGGNIIIRNTASGNLFNYTIVAGNDVGTVSTSPVGAGAWNNFSY